MFFKKKTNKSGFTLIEIMVSVSIFIIVAFVITSVFLTVTDANRKAQQIKLAMDNLSFALDSMTLKIREGTHYVSVSSDTFSFQNSDNESLTYSLIPASGDTPGRIEFSSPENPSSFITSSEVNITDLEFIIRDDVDESRKQVTILISGYAGNSVEDSSTFRIQTSVAQRNSG